jgi:hypothetical protein
MSRSKHTDPHRVRAPRRVRAPYAPRGQGEPHRRHALLRSLKALGGVQIDVTPAPGSTAAPLPRVRIHRPRKGYAHPASSAEIAALLRCVGEVGTYGLRAIELRQGPALRVPGTVVLYDQPPSPWWLVGRLPQGEQARLRRAGATVEEWDGGRLTVVTWPGGTLRDFMLFDVLLHEIGHHLVQQYTGKRRGRVARTRDHEAFADWFAQRYRRLYGSEAPG